MGLLNPVEADAYIEKIGTWKSKPDKLYKCRVCGKTPVVDQDVFGIKIEEKDSTGTLVTKWIICSDKGCVINQVKSFDVEVKPVKKSFGGYSKPARTVEESMDLAKQKEEFLYLMANQRFKTIFGKSIEDYVKAEDMQMAVKALDFIAEWSATMDTFD